MIRIALFLAVIGSVLSATPTHSAERCPLDVAACLDAYAHMRERPWLGVETDVDSTGTRRVMRTFPGSPAEKAGIQPGDVLRTIGGKAMREWFAEKSGWNVNDRTVLTVLRGERERNLDLELRPIPDELFARLIGTHMVEQHLAYLDSAPTPTH